MKIKKLRESKFSFKQYQIIDESYDNAERFVKLLAKPLKLGKYEKEMFEHDINNLRADEWIDLVKSLPENTPGRNEFIELYDKDTLDEDVSYEWKPNTSFKHIKDIYNKVKNNDYKYVNNEREEFMAAVKKAENKGYKPEECRQIKDWHREIWQKNRKINERYNKSDVNSVADFLDTVYKFNTMDDKYKCVCDILDKHDSESSVSIEKDELIKFAKNYKGKILEESLGSDYSHIEEVKSIDFSNDKNNNLPGIPNTKKFKNALNSVGQDAFKIRTSRLNGISTADLKDEFGGNGMKPWKFFKDRDNSVKGFNEFYFFYKTGKFPKKSTNEAFDVDKVQKRIAHVDEFDNGHVIHNDWTTMSSQEAEEKAKQMSIENPDKVYYVKYDNVMEPSSNIKWKNGEQLTEDVPMEYTDTSKFKDLQDESDGYQAELKRKNTNRAIMHKVFDKYGLMDSDESWADRIYWLCANAQEIEVVDDASKVPHKTNDGAKIKYVMSTPRAEVDIHADAFKDYLWIVTKDSLEESISFDDNEFFTREEINEAAEKVIEHINETFNEKYILGGTWLEKGIWTVNVQTEDGMYEFETNCQIDMRKVKKPSDIEKFVLPIAADIIEQIKENNESLTEDVSNENSKEDKFILYFPYNEQSIVNKERAIKALEHELSVIKNNSGSAIAGRGYAVYCLQSNDEKGTSWEANESSKEFINSLNYRTESLSEDLSGKYSDKFRALIREYSDSDSVIALVDDIIRYAKEDDLKDLFINRDYEKFMPEETLEEAFDVRANTNKVIELAEEGVISWQSIAEASLIYMSEYDVADMARLYNWVEDDEDKDEASYSVRKVTNEVTELAEEGVISWESIAQAALRYMSEYDVTDMASMYSWIEDEEDIDESCNKLKEDLQNDSLTGPQEGPEAGIATLLNTAIQDKFATIQSYNDLAVTARHEGFEDIATAMDSLNVEENAQVGKLQDLLKTVAPNAAAIDNDIVEM